MVNELDYLKESTSQTAGPYVHIGLAPHQAGFDIFETSPTTASTAFSMPRFRAIGLAPAATLFTPSRKID